MKKILLSSAAIVAFAGAAAAEISASGSIALGYNDTVEDGVYYDADMDLAGSMELNNGWTAGFSFGFELEELSTGLKDNLTVDQNLVLSLTNGTYGLYFGDTEYAAKSLWSGVSEMVQDDFSEQEAEEVLKLTANVADIELAFSAPIDSVAGDLGQRSFGAKGSFSGVNLSVAYQNEAAAPDGSDSDYTADEIFAISAGTSFSGADITVAYAKTNGETSTGLEVSYPVGDVTVSAFYVAESDFDNGYGVSAVYAAGALSGKAYYKSVKGSDEYGIGGAYDLGNGLVVTAGYVDGDSLTDDDFGMYIVADYDLGGGASFIASYANADVAGSDDIDTIVGGYELLDGMTLELGLAF